MAFFNFVTEQGVCQFKNQHVEFDIFLSFNEGKSFIVTYQLLKASCHEKTALIIWLILGGIYVIGKCLTRAFSVKQIIFYSHRFMRTRSWEFMLQKAIWNLCLKNMYPIWDIYSIKFQFEMHILLSEFISPPASTWLLQSNQPSQSSQISRQVQHMYFCRLIQMYL